MIFGLGLGIAWQTFSSRHVEAAAVLSCREAGLRVGQAALRLRGDRVRQQCRNSHEVVGEHSGAHPQFEAVASFGETALHAAASEQHRDASLDAGAKALTILECRAALVRFAPRCSLAAPLRDAHLLDASVLARCQVLLTEEAAIRAIQLRSPAKGLPVTLGGRMHVDLVGRIAFQHLVLRDQALPRFRRGNAVPAR